MEKTENFSVPEENELDSSSLNAIRGGGGGQGPPDRDPDDDLLIPD